METIVTVTVYVSGEDSFTREHKWVAMSRRDALKMARERAKENLRKGMAGEGWRVCSVKVVS